jgi:hypothetical protein
MQATTASMLRNRGSKVLTGYYAFPRPCYNYGDINRCAADAEHVTFEVIVNCLFIGRDETG